MNRQDTLDAAQRGPIREFLDHLLSEVRRLDRRCAQLEGMLHDFAILFATSGEPQRASLPAQRTNHR